MSQRHCLAKNWERYAKSFCLLCFLCLPFALGVPQGLAAPQKKTAQSSAKKTSSSKKVTARPVQNLNLAEQPSDESRESLRDRGVYSAFGWRSVGKKRSRFHKGIDISAPSGSPIQAYDDGTVTFSGRKSGYGICVFIEHDDGLVSLYAHMSKTPLKTGDEVRQGDVVGHVGRTGRTTGAHLHFEILQDGKHLNPANHVQDGRELVAAAHVGAGAKIFAGVSQRKGALATTATIKAAQKFAEQARLGLPVTFNHPGYDSPSALDRQSKAVN